MHHDGVISLYYHLHLSIHVLYVGFMGARYYFRKRGGSSYHRLCLVLIYLSGSYFRAFFYQSQNLELKEERAIFCG